jgi:hypothetical protein
MAHQAGCPRLPSAEREDRRPHVAGAFDEALGGGHISEKRILGLAARSLDGRPLIFVNVSAHLNREDLVGTLVHV